MLWRITTVTTMDVTSGEIIVDRVSETESLNDDQDGADYLCDQSTESDGDSDSDLSVMGGDCAMAHAHAHGVAGKVNIRLA